MSNDPDRIRWEIENTRNELSTDVDALADKVNPRRIAGERVGQARGAVGRVREKVMGTSMQARERVMGTSTHAKERVMDTSTHAKDKVMGASMHARERAMEVPSHLGDGGRISHAADSARHLGQQSRQQAQGNPLAAGLIAFGAGLLVASLVPPSRPERQLAGQARGMVSEHSDQLREQAGRVGHNVRDNVRDNLRDNLREPVRQAAQAVGSTAVGSAHAVQEQGRSAAQQVQGQAHEAADDLRRR
ncbi:DUF3618 domain-containing protein [Micromonospora phytophila]|uniref:DUF3618 domain-containing protein n=1 Tax=Micromonospora phytophila TaxID=709888 RepID=UPI00202DBEE1|nr:DUF3618 domain-containing protein [Micromonospora phytophila]MCM0676294.1 DUF3618 domain-containing protein [Micromonospora phytophila]